MCNQALIIAYLDPSTGSLVIQGLIAAFVSIGFVFRRVLVKPWAMLFGRRDRDNDVSHPSEERSVTS